MRKKHLAIAVVVALSASMMMQSCIGSFALYNKVKTWNEHVGDKFPRIRFGVGKCPPKFDLSNWVLAKFSPEDRPVFDEAIAKVPALVECYFKFGIEKCMERYNGK